MVQSRIFMRNRALGYVSNHVPVVTRYIQRRKENLIVTCVGKEVHIYGCAHFTLLSVSGTHPENISCLSADTYHIYTAAANVVYAWRRGSELKHTYKDVNDSTNAQQRQNNKDLQNLTAFGKLLSSAMSDENCLEIINRLKSLGPSSIDFEIQSLSSVENNTNVLLLQFMKMLYYMMKCKTDFELSQAYLAVFLKWHGPVISETKELGTYLKKIENLRSKNWFSLIREMLFYNLSILQALRKLQ